MTTQITPMNPYRITPHDFLWKPDIKCYGVDIDPSIVDRKYSAYETAVESGDIGHDYDATQLLSDDTIYAYAFLRWENQPVKLYPFQDAIMNDDHKRIDIEGANQIGKSYLLCIKASVQFLRSHGKNYTIGLISKSMSQNSMNMRMIRKLLKESDIEFTPGPNDSMTVMTHNLGDGFTNTLVCSVASTSSLGFPFDLMLLDEFEFWENPEGLEYMYDQILEPRTFRTKGQIIIFSNPNGRNFVSDNLQKRQLSDNSPQFHTYNFNFLDNPNNTRDEYETRKKYVHPIIFASTMAAKRTESQGSALTMTDINLTKDKDLDRIGFHGVNKNESWWFLDLGFVYDQSVLTSCYITKNDLNESVYNFAIKPYPVAHDLNELWGFDPSDEDSVPYMVKTYGGDGALFELDLTGKEGTEVLADKAGLTCSGVKMTGPWKAKWYDRFISLVKQGRVKVQQIDNWLDGVNKNFAAQASTLKISTKTSDGRNRPYPLYHHTTEKDHDDIIDSVAGCLSLCDDEFSDGPSYDTAFIPTGPREVNGELVDENGYEIPTFEEFIENMEIPEFLKHSQLREWYNMKYGLTNKLSNMESDRFRGGEYR